MPTRAQSICTHPGCSVLVSKGHRCDKHLKPKHGWQEDRGTNKERGYGWTWTERRQRVLRRDNYLCQECSRHNRVTAANEVDHIVPKAIGGTDDSNNLQSLCVPCHQAKTLKERT
jgi:5-methylcytosine-specific restriction protein A